MGNSEDGSQDFYPFSLLCAITVLQDISTIVLQYRQ